MKTKALKKKTNLVNLLSFFVKKTFNFTICSLVVAAFLFMPFSFDTGDLSIGVTAAFAQNEKDKSDKGEKVEKGDRDKNKQDKKVSKKGNAFGHTKEDNLEDDGDTKAKISKLLGRLNAAHSSQTAKDNASKNSAVGMIKAYEEALLAYRDNGDEDSRQVAIKALEAASNKPVDDDVVDAVNFLLGYHIPLDIENPPPALKPEEEL